MTQQSCGASGQLLLNRILHSYPVRLVFVIGALVLAFLVIQFRKLMRWDTNSGRARI